MTTTATRFLVLRYLVDSGWTFLPLILLLAFYDGPFLASYFLACFLCYDEITMLYCYYCYKLSFARDFS